PALKSASYALIENDAGITGCEAFLVDLKDSSPNLTSSHSYLPQAVEKWLAETEQILDAEYQQKWGALPLESRCQPNVRKEFGRRMTQFVHVTIDKRLVLLDAELRQAFQRSQVKMPGLIVGWVAPFLLVGAAFTGFFAYLKKISVHSRSSPRGRICQGLTGYAFSAPWLFGFILFSLGPILAALALSFTDWNMIRGPRWLGAQNYLQMFLEKTFYWGLWRTFSYAFWAIPISMLGGLFTAGLLTANIRGANFFKAAIYFPSIFTGAEAAVLWVNMFNREYGIVNRILGIFKIPPVSWLDQTHAFTTVILMNFFWIGSSMIVYYAAMKQIPSEFYEAAEIDGANFFQKFFHITIPLLSPVILFMVVMTSIGAFQ
ncbi:MAG: sugar ABC transporter permease, partial [Candidatus Omnitrophica bacterium]|nr:sugar ABC transporter permease [Candidatus Omnitrophota bacterium]